MTGVSNIIWIKTWKELHQVLEQQRMKRMNENTGVNAISEQLSKYQPDTDKVTLGASGTEVDAGIYRRPNQLKPLSDFGTISWADPESEEELPYQFGVISEDAKIVHSSVKGYTQEDALMNQYMKQYRFEIDVTTGRQLTEGPVKLMLPEMVTDEELEAYRQKLCVEGLGEEIDWKGVEHDLSRMTIGFSNVEDMGTKADYLASRYAVLKDRIQTQYSSEEQVAQMEKLNQLYEGAKTELADTYAKYIGSFYEGLGEAGIAEEFRANIMTLVEEKTAAYEAHLAGAGDYATISNPEDTWLLQDDGYLAAQLRESYASSGGEAVGNSNPAATEDGTVSAAPEKASGAYSMEDLIFIGQYARELKSQLDSAPKGHISAKEHMSDTDLGKALASEKRYIEDLAGSSGLGSEAEELVNRVFLPFIEKYLDGKDLCIDRMRQEQYSWLFRTSYIDRDAVYSAYFTAGKES